MMHVLFSIPAYAPFVGGAQTFAHAMARRLVADGRRVTVLTTNARRVDDFWRPSPGQELAAHEVLDGVQVIRLPIRYPRPAPYRFGLLRRAGHWLGRSTAPDAVQQLLLGYLARFMPPLHDLSWTVEKLMRDVDLVQAIDATWDGLFTTVGRTAARMGKPLVVVPLMHSGSRRILAEFTMPHQIAIYRQAAAVVALSQPEYDQLAQYQIARERLHILSMGVEAHSTSVPSGLPLAFGDWYNSEQPLIAFVGAATYDKGAFTLIRALLALWQRGVNCRLVCAGPQQNQLRRFIDAYPPAERRLLQEHVRLLGVVDEPTKHALLAAANVLALPSRVDAFGIAILEAWLHAKPVVAAAEGGLVQTVAEGETGLLVPFGDAMALAAALERLFKDQALAEQLGEAGRCKVMACYTWDRTYEELLTIYAQLYPSSSVNRPAFGGDDHASASQQAVPGLVSHVDAAGDGCERIH